MGTYIKQKQVSRINSYGLSAALVPGKIGFPCTRPE
jgi:hypothetical protein